MARALPPIVGFRQVLRRMLGIGRTVREGRIARIERFHFTQPGNLAAAIDGAATASPDCAWIYLDDDPEPVGWVHAAMLLNRARRGERVRLAVHPEDGHIGALRPLDRRVRWWQN